MAKWTGNTILSRALSILLALVILAAVIIIFTLPSAPEDKFSEFYILGSGGMATDYPSQAEGGNREVTLVIINREQETISYQVEISIDGNTTGEIGPIVLKPGEKFEQTTNLAFYNTGTKQKVEFLLYKEGQPGVYRSLNLGVGTTEKN